MITYQELLSRLSHFWEKQGCIIHQGYDLEMGAGTFNPATFLRCLGPEPYKAAYIEPCRRPTDGRYGTNPNRLQHYFQYQVLLKPSPFNIQDLYLESLEAIGFKLQEHDIRFVHDDWEAPTQGAWGLGWEVWMDGMEVTQFTYFQSVAGQALKPITGEITYGTERLAMYLQKVNSFFDLKWNEDLTYGDIYQRNEVEWSHYNFENASIEMWFRHFEDYEREAKKLIDLNFPIPAYDFVIKASHAFNLLDARGVISVTERTGYIARIRTLACQIAESYLKSRSEQQFPLSKRFAKSFHAAEKTTPSALSHELLEGQSDHKEDFLLEVGSEELPATFVPIGCANLEKALRQLLEKEGLSYKEIKVYGTPRRLSAYIKDLAMGKAAQTAEKRGPPINQTYHQDGTLTPAGEGFFRSLNKEAPSLQDLNAGKGGDIAIRQIKGTDYIFANVTTSGQATATLLAAQLSDLILGLDFPKKMRWADLDIAFPRPIRWIVSLFGKHVVPFAVGNVIAGRESFGHRQLCPWNFSLLKAQDYLPLLKEHHVMVDIEERKQSIIAQLDELESKIGAKIIEREAVIPQVLHLVEWPELTWASFAENFLKAPKEVLISEMVEHQKYFPVANPDGTLKNAFIITANTHPTDQIREGNQRVLSSRLTDGVFLYEKGLQVPLEEFNEKLKHVTFQKDLGSVYEKVLRLKAHVKILQRTLGIGDTALVDRAAILCKADLASEMVYEFPELQGTIGKYYALAQGESKEVAQAIDEHWMPRGEKAPLPETETGIILSLAEKIDNLLGCFCVNLKPTSSSDPYALRRQVLGIIKILIKGRHRLNLKNILQQCLQNFPAELRKNSEQLIQEIEAFITNRIKTVFQDYGFSKDEIEASLASGFVDIYDTFCRVQALHHFRESGKQFPLLYEVYKRAKGQLLNQRSVAFSPALLKENAEKDLDHQLSTIQDPFTQAIGAHNYGKAYELIAQLQPPLATLFDEVKILADEESVRDNRIALLNRVFGLFGQLLDFSKIQAK